MDEYASGEVKEKFIHRCIQTQVWDKINASINAVVDSISLEDLVEEYKA